MHEVEGVDLRAVAGEAARAPALRGADLDREGGLQPGQQAFQGRALAERHLPGVVGEQAGRGERGPPSRVGATPLPPQGGPLHEPPGQLGHRRRGEERERQKDRERDPVALEAAHDRVELRHHDHVPQVDRVRALSDPGEHRVVEPAPRAAGARLEHHRAPEQAGHRQRGQQIRAPRGGVAPPARGERQREAAHERTRGERPRAAGCRSPLTAGEDRREREPGHEGDQRPGERPLRREREPHRGGQADAHACPDGGHEIESRPAARPTRCGRGAATAPRTGPGRAGRRTARPSATTAAPPATRAGARVYVSVSVSGGRAARRGSTRGRRTWISTKARRAQAAGKMRSARLRA